ncbi:hypothetical protein MMPV_007619 [Pyropia vietnamensis]
MVRLLSGPPLPPSSPRGGHASPAGAPSSASTPPPGSGAAAMAAAASAALAARPPPLPPTAVAALRSAALSKDGGVGGGGLIRASVLGAAGLTVYDPGYTNTASATSTITYIDGGRGILRYRGYPIEQLAARSHFLETAYLLSYGELPTADQAAAFTSRVAAAAGAGLPADVHAVVAALPRDVHPMSALVTGLAALGGVRPETNPALAGPRVYDTPAAQDVQLFRVLAAMPLLAAAIYRHARGRPPVSPRPYDPAIHGTAGSGGGRPFSYTGMFLDLLERRSEGSPSAVAHPVVVRALDTLLLLHADHELNCSTATVRQLASSGVDATTAVAGATAALYGPLHGGATEAVLGMLGRLAAAGGVAAIPKFLATVKRGEVKLMGFGHRVYRQYDPRATLVRRLAYEVFEAVAAGNGSDRGGGGDHGSDGTSLVDIAVALEKAALADDYFASRRLYPNVDFYTGVIYQALGLDAGMYTVLFAIGRAAGWMAHWREFLADPEARIARPRQWYVGAPERAYVDMAMRGRGGARRGGPCRR